MTLDCVQHIAALSVCLLITTFCMGLSAIIVMGVIKTYLTEFPTNNQHKQQQ